MGRDKDWIVELMLKEIYLGRKGDVTGEDYETSRLKCVQIAQALRAEMLRREPEDMIWYDGCFNEGKKAYKEAME